MYIWRTRIALGEVKVCNMWSYNILCSLKKQDTPPFPVFVLSYANRPLARASHSSCRRESGIYFLIHFPPRTLCKKMTQRFLYPQNVKLFLRELKNRGLGLYAVIAQFAMLVCTIIQTQSS